MKEIMTLKKYIAESKELEEPVNYFFDLMEQDKILHAPNHQLIGRIENHTELRLAIDIAINTVNKVLNKNVHFTNPVFHEFAQEKFYHGYCMISESPMPLLLLYSSDIQIGIAVLSGLDGNTSYFRFSLTMVDDIKTKH